MDKEGYRSLLFSMHKRCVEFIVLSHGINGVCFVFSQKTSKTEEEEEEPVWNAKVLNLCRHVLIQATI